MNRVVPLAAFVELVAPFSPQDRCGSPPFSVETFLRVRLMQQGFTLRDPAMREARHDTPVLREFAGRDNRASRLRDESTISRFRHLLEKHQPAAQALNGQLHAKPARAACEGRRMAQGEVKPQCHMQIRRSGPPNRRIAITALLDAHLPVTYSDLP